MQESDVVLAIIGPRWASAADDRARRSLLDRTDEDLVRLEGETAFTHGAIVIPVLVDDAEMPARESLTSGAGERSRFVPETLSGEALRL